MSRLSDSLLEAFYLTQVLSQFDVIVKNLRWEGHFDIHPGASAHFFSTSEGDFMLVFEDYPLLIEADLLDLIRTNQALVPVPLKKEGYIYDFNPPDNIRWKYVPAGSFRLYRVI